MAVTLGRICRYPVKGLSPDTLERVPLTTGRALPHDRRFAIARATTPIDTADPEWLPKSKFHVLMRDEKLAQLDTAYDAETTTLTVYRKGKQVTQARLADPMGRVTLSQFFAAFLGDDAKGTPKVVDAGDRTTVSLPAREVVHRDRDERVAVAPRLRVRYPGERLVVHPAPNDDYTLFPSFGLDLDDVPNPLPVAADGATIDEEAVAEAADASLAERPYAERVLWQAFCYTAFDPVDEARPTLAQFDSGRTAVVE